MAYNITLTGKNNKEAKQLLLKSVKIINKTGLDYWLEGGTLLGIYRENRLLPWDNDVDISMLFPGTQKINELIANLKKKGLRVRVRTFSKDCSPLNEGELKLIKIRKKHFFGLVKGNVCLEIFIKHTIDKNTYWQIGNKVKYVPSKFYKKLKTLSFENFRYKVPYDLEAYLSYRYGDWKTPQKNWNTFRDDKAIQ